MTYNSIYISYKAFTRPKILLGNKSIKNRLIRNVIIIFTGIILMAIFGIYHNFSSQTLETTYLVIFYCFCFSSIIVIRTNRYDIKNLIKAYPNIVFTEIEKKDMNMIIERIQEETLLNLLADKKNDIQYLKKMIEYSLELSEYSKVQLVSIKELGFTAIVVLLLNQYFDTIYKKWSSLSNYTLTVRTGAILFIFSVILFLYFFIRLVTDDILNSNHKNHKKLYFLLKRVEDSAIYNQEPIS